MTVASGLGLAEGLEVELLIVIGSASLAKGCHPHFLGDAESCGGAEQSDGAGRLEAVRSLATGIHDQRVVNRLSEIAHHGSIQFRVEARRSLRLRDG
jgi:hypothetical protein